MNIDKWKSTGDNPDIHLLYSDSLYRLIESGLTIDLRDYNNGFVDFQHFEVGLLSYGYGDNEEIFSFPYSNAMEYPLFYNKDIFDRFGIPYPNDGMTWNEVIELAHKVTGEINGVH